MVGLDHLMNSSRATLLTLKAELDLEPIADYRVGGGRARARARPLQPLTLELPFARYPLF